MSWLRFEETGSTSGGVSHGMNANGRSLCAGELSAAGRDDGVMVADEGRVAFDDAEVVHRVLERVA